ncbi:N-acetyl-1-D-myo-inositol-2-amino-2-deoxy-alpha-D-glucopyranoside deacetylase [Corynebacterium uterequi]|uniref:1D-myo-inositol 2-acetamido-2-deoxy-alpha-D-glucopyranoside deacetylase n=1 Tax=Corynebacterium uterequi TaxID=1072256 RepID=A0A0G3HI57_9CORY|nr:N-acetyl-1-D-myo-inositol-2-amino-2-deoxy-alpha-D-glucopyranoside deacetylase [Corynebacterium uterequi]AKK10817.1 N-acetyl-1-D-myo-inositol-2-amino-2-deoxy-alpha-D-glucopyranoside deacetylase [Corynebacterium uterequi]
MTRDLAGYRVLAVHAHPDDESLWTGGALASLAQRGADVTVVTCTLGEEGEVIGETYQELVADHGDQLGGFRIGELREALGHLGVHGIHLGAPGRYRDSGMAGSPAHANPRAFVNNTDRAVEDLVEVLAQYRPHVLITYGPDGGYGHPDHIQAHRISHLAAEQVPVGRILWAVTERAELTAGLAALRTIPAGWRRADDEIASVDGSDVAVDLDDQAYYAKAEAMRAHATQLWLADGRSSHTNPHPADADSAAGLVTFALSNLIAQPLMCREHYQVGSGPAYSSPSACLLEGLER